LLGVSLFFKFFHVLGFNLNQSTNLYIILSLIIGALGCYLLAREFSSSEYLPIVFSSIYIIHQWNFVHFAWLNFLSRFIIPFIFLFFIRFFKTKKKIYILFASFLAFYQFLLSIYYGIHLWIFLIPAFLILAVILKLLIFRDFLKIVLALGICFLLIIWIFYPFTTNTQLTLEKDTSGPFINGADLFSYSRIFLLFFDYPEKLALNLFPGFTFFLFLLFFFVPRINKKKLKTVVFIVFIILTIAMTCLAYVNIKILNVLLAIFLSLTLILMIINWKKMIKWEKLILLTFSFYLILFLKFEGLPFLKSFSFLELFNTLLPFEGLKNIRRVYLIILPFLIVLATVGGDKFLRTLKRLTKRRIIVISVVILCLIILENIRIPFPITQRRLMREISDYNLDVYKKLPFRQNRIILEIPFYFKKVTQNSIYSLNWQFHQNCLLNGKTSIEPRRYLDDLENIIGRLQKIFPDEPALKALIEKYSVNYVIFHWGLLSRYQNNPKTKENIMQKIKSIYKYGNVIYNENNTTVLKVQETIPVQKIVRNYSLYHLKYNRIQVQLIEKYSGEVEIIFNDHLIEKRKLNADFIELDFTTKKLRVEGNEIELIFDKPVLLNDIKLSSF
jgi:hypothetical protein